MGVIPTDGMILTGDTQLAAGTYVLPNGLTIGADGITVAGDNTLILSPEQKGSAITIDGRRNVTIRDLAISGFYYGVRADRSEHITVEKVRVRDTWEIEGIDTFLYLWLPIEQAYSGAILFHEVRGGVIRGCDLQHQMNAILLYDCADLTVEKNNGSFNSGWGVYLSNTSDSVIQDNQLDFCNRVYRRPENGSIRVEADAAGIVLVKGASRNQFLRNSLLCGGDGIFIAGYEHPNKVTPCNDNLFEDNDCRLSPNNAIEATFSKGNIFRRNDCSRSNYGFWLGYSWENVLEDNLVEFNRWVGIAAEHAHDMVMRRNKIRLNGEGVRLWTRGNGGELIGYWPGFEVPFNCTLEDNTFENNTVGFAGYTGDDSKVLEAHHFSLRGNTFNDNRVGVHLNRVQDTVIEGNIFTKNLEAAIRLKGRPGATLDGNTFENNQNDTLEVDDTPEART
jgi:parallel beta-helix repeat protein